MPDTLPGQNQPTEPLPIAPGTQPQVKPSPVPSTWQDPLRAIRIVLDLWALDQDAAVQVHQFAQYLWDRVAQGK